MALFALPSFVFSCLVSPIYLFHLVGPGLLAWIALIVIRRAWFSPLSNFPGPRLAAVSGLWLMWQDIVCNGATTQLLLKLHLEYGVESLHNGVISAS
jgi:hypothetical protein